ncbi:DUF1294 domain-containing protein [Jeotgalibaca dankookensis]|nr:DUF1294 domain-containing protein [Jeotgalibaca dankookensis]
MSEEVMISWLIFANSWLFGLMYIDKKKASKRQWRIPERTLLILGILGGAFGGLFGMIVFRHKTKHTYFYWIYGSMITIWLGFIFRFYN